MEATTMTRTILHPWMTHPHTGKPLEAVGIVRGRPVWPIMGASEDDPTGDPEEDPEDDPEEDPEDDPEPDDPWAGKSEAELRAELAKISKAHATAKSQAQRWREFGQGKTDTAPDGTKRSTPPKSTPPKPAPPKTKDGALTQADLDAAVAAAVEAAKNETRTESNAAAIRTSARAELKAAGLVLPDDGDDAKKALNQAVRMLDLDSVTFEDGEVVGLDDAIDSLKKLLPSMFGRSTSNGNGRRRAPNPGNTGGGKGGGGKPKSATEQQAALIFGGGD